MEIKLQDLIIVTCICVIIILSLICIIQDVAIKDYQTIIHKQVDFIKEQYCFIDSLILK